ncbi:acyltransferase [Kineosporia sp. A_224]|uniref:acyltransferase n=1 Tax=Kineosporia sp. A_224 TaxID=1962180 RepID=UPI000B4B3102|nr:acyltransferase family protein [Kineosporia sp. A_224]
MTSDEPDPRAEPLVLAAAAHEPTGWFDLARVLAILAVVVVHETSGEVGSRDAGDPATAAWWTANILDSASRWCVPVFLMVSGALLLDPRRTDRPRDFYRRRLGRIGVPLVVWTAVYLVFRSFYLGDDLDAGQAARDVAAGTPFLQLYFLYVLVVLYLLTPFLRLVVRHTTHRMQAAFGAVLLGLGALDQVLSSFLDVGGASAATRFLPYAGYFTLGWLLRDVPLSGRAVRGAAVAFAGSVVATAGLVAASAAFVGWGNPGRYLYGYLSPTVVVMSLSAYVLLRAWGLRHPPGARWAPGRRTAALSALTFGVYLVHPLFFYPLRRLWPAPQAWPLWVGVTAAHLALTVAGSLALTWVILRIPVLRRAI